MNRRQFLLTTGALVIAHITPAIAFPETDWQRWLRLMRTGLVENQRFYLTGPIVLNNVNGLIVRNCYFTQKLFISEHVLDIYGTCSNITIIDNIFNIEKRFS